MCTPASRVRVKRPCSLGPSELVNWPPSCLLSVVYDPLSGKGGAMKAHDIMAKNPKFVTPETTVREAAQLMKSEDVGMLPVVRSKGSKSIVGVVTDRDIAIRHVAE